MTRPSGWIRPWWRSVLFSSALWIQFGACTHAVEPSHLVEDEAKASSARLAATTGKIAGNAVYQVRKESGASAYDPVTKTTYVTYNGPDMDIYVRAFDNTRSAWGPLTLAKAWTHYEGGVRWAYHNYSAMVLGPDRRLHILQADHARALYEIVSPTGSMTGAWTESLVSRDRTAYPSVNLVGNSIYIVYVRDYGGTPDTYRRLRFIKKDWNGSSWSAWSAPRTIIDTKRMMGTSAGRGDLYDEVYQQSVSLFDDKLWITFHLAGGAVSCPASPSGHNCGAKDLYLAGLDVRTPAAPGNMYSVGGKNLGASITCTGLGVCPEFLNVGTGARVASFPADPQSADWSLSHPVSFSMAGWSSGTRTYFVAYNLGGPGDLNSVKLARFAGGSWNHITVDQGRGYGLRDIAMTGGSSIELAYVTGAPVKVKSRLVTYSGAWPAAVGALYPDLAVPMSGSPIADRVSFLQIVTPRATSGQALKLFGSTFNNAVRQTDYSGAWSAFGLYYR